MIRYANIQDAKAAVLEWGGEPSSIVHVGDHGNSIYSFLKNGNRQILRLTDPSFRSLDEVVAELVFVNQLHAGGTPVAAAVRSERDLLAFNFDCTTGPLICSSIEFAKGIEVTEGSQHWNQEFFKEWGRNLGLIHRVSEQLTQPVDSNGRWQWGDENLFQLAERLIPRDDFGSREELNEIFSECKKIERSSSTFGLIHADHAPQNFRFDVDRNLITAFDFGNCCNHWYIADVAIALSTIRRKPNRQLIRDCILEGYSAIRPLPNNHEYLIDLFIRLRVVYFYLSRLYMWSENRTPEKEKQLLLAKERVHSKFNMYAVPFP
jgi:amicoumacin kinase